MSFDRNKAVTYADRHWNVPADDGVFWLSNQGVKIEEVRQKNVLHAPYWQKAAVADGWQPMFVDDGNGGEKAVFRRVHSGRTEEILINPWAGIADCAHFLSRCLSAGGLPVAELSVPTLVEHLRARKNTKTLCERVGIEAGQRVIDSGVFKPGDMVGYFNVDSQGDYGGKQEYSHSAMYVGKIGGNKDGGITCHTICRFPGRSWVEDSWWLKPSGHYTYTLIHISDDDPTPNPGKAGELAGWWKVEHSGKTDYYLVHKGGSAQSTKTAPARGQNTIHAQGSAYWFMGLGGETTFIWRATGTVEVWSPERVGYKGKMNGVIPVNLSKLTL